jgi:serine/threonine protein kinase
MRTLAGRTIGAYVLKEYLGEGAFAGVFLTEQHMLGARLRRVALKLSKRVHMTEEETRELFADVFLLAGAMDQANDAEARLHLVHVYDAGLTDGDNRAFMTMEYVPGTTLADRFARQTKVDAGQLMTWVTQVGTALRGLHGLAEPLVHRDLKPDNVLLGLDNVVRLVDFGLADRLLHLGYVPGVAGTLAYMAPETSQGRSTPASDIYSLGLLIYEGLTGQHPFRDLIPPSGQPDALYSEWLYDAKRSHPAVAPSLLNNTVSPELNAIVLRCLEFEPERRFPDAGEFLAALSGEGLAAQPVEIAIRALRDDGSVKNLHRARHAIEDQLAGPDLPRDTRFDLLRKLGEVLGSLGDHAGAAKRFGQAWQLTEDSAILRDTHERVALLTQLIDAHRLAGNDFQARRYQALRDKERGGGR